MSSTVNLGLKIEAVKKVQKFVPYENNRTGTFFSNFVFYVDWDQSYYYLAFENCISFVALEIEEFFLLLANDSYRMALSF